MTRKVGMTEGGMAMHDYILLMHNDTQSEPTNAQWSAYFDALSASGAFQGGSAIGQGASFRRDGGPAPKSTPKPTSASSDHLTGFIRVSAASLSDAQTFLTGNPVYECGGTVEIRELPRD